MTPARMTRLCDNRQSRPSWPARRRQAGFKARFSTPENDASDAGRRPYRFQTYLSQEIERVIGSEEPERPSMVTRRKGSAIRKSDAEAPDSTHASRRRLRRRLAGERDDIVMMALRKEPQRRYASAERYSDDIGRHLEGRPVRVLRSSPGAGVPATAT
jgi:hypothetical protein